MSGKLVIIEGLDGSGKTTQLNLLKENLKLKDVSFISFPNYESDSGRIISEYLENGFFEKNKNTSAYSASCFYAADRYISFKTDWGKLLNNNIHVISARYVSSNAIYQMAKLEKSEWENYINWLYDFEFNKLNLPRADKTIFLDMPLNISQDLLSKRYNNVNEKKDIHEIDTAFLLKCHEAAIYVAKKEKWDILRCAEDDFTPRTVSDIQSELIKKIEDIINDRV